VDVGARGDRVLIQAGRVRQVQRLFQDLAGVVVFLGLIGRDGIFVELGNLGDGVIGVRLGARGGSYEEEGDEGGDDARHRRLTLGHAVLSSTKKGKAQAGPTL
jgi:hypothetical protein